MMGVWLAFPAAAYVYPSPFYPKLFGLTVLLAVAGAFFVSVIAMDIYYRDALVLYTRKSTPPASALAAAAAAAAASSSSSGAQNRLLPSRVHLTVRNIDEDRFEICLRPGSPRSPPIVRMAGCQADWMFADGSFNLDRLRADTVAALAARGGKQ